MQLHGSVKHGVTSRCFHFVLLLVIWGFRNVIFPPASPWTRPTVKPLNTSYWLNVWSSHSSLSEVPQLHGDLGTAPAALQSQSAPSVHTSAPPPLNPPPYYRHSGLWFHCLLPNPLQSNREQRRHNTDNSLFPCVAFTWRRISDSEPGQQSGCTDRSHVDS